MTTGTPSAVQGSASGANSGVPAPSVGVAVIALGRGAELRSLLAGLLPACRESQVEIFIAAREATDALPADGDLVRSVVLGLEATEGELRRLALLELAADVVVFTTDLAPLLGDWSQALPRLAQVVVSREAETPGADWRGVLARLNVDDPGA